MERAEKLHKLFELLNQLFQLLNLVRIYGRDCELKRTLMTKNVNNDFGKDSPIG